MLTRLILHDFVFVKRIEIEFSDGFCVLTGETGAGKSLLVGALALLAGGRAAASMVRAPADCAEVQAAFDIAGNDEVRQHLQQQQLDAGEGEQDTLLVRRVIGGRKSAAYVNGRQVALAQLAELMALLMDICGQHAHYSLRRASSHRPLLDSYAGADTAAVAAAHARWRGAEEEYATAAAALQQDEQKRAMLLEIIAELEALDFSAARWQEMNDTLTRTANLGDLTDGCAEILRLLQGEDAGGSAQTLVASARRQLDELCRKEARLADSLKVLDDADALLSEVAREIASYADGLQADPAAHAAAEDFVSACHRAARKYGLADAAQLGDFLADKQAALAALPTAASVDGLAQAAAAARKTLDTHCRALSKKRGAAAKALCKEVNALLAQLAMPKAALSVLLEAQETPTAHGAEKVTLQIATRSDTPAGGIGEVASGGELSRLGLAIQIASGRVRGAALSVFDEVDAGIGGAAAGVVGALLRQLGGRRQVLCVTHLPQVAAQAHAHWRVAGGEQLTVSQLTVEQRVEEIARMQSGEVVTDAARRYAQELLQA